MNNQYSDDALVEKIAIDVIMKDLGIEWLKDE